MTAMQDIQMIVRGPSQSVAVPLTVSMIHGKPWTTWLEDYSRIVAENQALQREKAALEAQVEALRGKKKKKPKIG